jgi:hypothetical protein
MIPGTFQRTRTRVGTLPQRTMLALKRSFVATTRLLSGVTSRRVRHAVLLECRESNECIRLAYGN